MADEQEEPPPYTPDVHFEPVMKLPLVETKTLEEDEDVLFKMRARLFRYTTIDDVSEWKERGTGEVKILKQHSGDGIRILMRRDKTLKICANHYITPCMDLKPNNTSDKAWMWSTVADFADEEPKHELFAIKFGTPENAKKFKVAFDQAKELVSSKCEDTKEDVVPEEDESDTSKEEIKESGDSTSKQSDESKTEESEKPQEVPENPEAKDTETLTEKLEILSVKENQDAVVPTSLETK